MFWFNRYLRTQKITTKLLVLIIAIFITLLVGLADAESEKIKLDVFPTSVELPSIGKEVQTVVVLRNLTQDVLHDVHLSAFNTNNVEIQGNEKSLNSLPSNAEFVWNIKLSQQQDNLISENIYFRVDYAYAKEKNAQLIKKVLIQSLEVKSRQISSVEEIADIEVKTTLESLNENRPGVAHLVIKNKSNVLIQIKDVLPTGPNFICFKNNCSDNSKEKIQDDKIFPKPLSPQKSLVIPIQIVAKERVQPGKHLLLFDVLLMWQEAGMPQTDHLIVTHEVNVGVLGESEILTLLGLPSFLLLPGFLIITTMNLLWNLRFLRLKSDIDKFPLEFNTPEFWLISVTLSGLVAFGYILSGRNYLDSYGLRDIVNVWLFSVFALGFAVYLLIMSFRLRLYMIRRMPSPKDEPITILKKLGRQKRKVYLETFDLEIEGHKIIQRAFILEPPESSRNKLWVGPPIKIEWLCKINENEEFKNKVNEQITEHGNPKILATLLEEGVRKKCLQVRWKPINDLPKPKEFKQEDIQTISLQDKSYFVNYE